MKNVRKGPEIEGSIGEDSRLSSGPDGAMVGALNRDKVIVLFQEIGGCLSIFVVNLAFLHSQSMETQGCLVKC